MTKLHVIAALISANTYATPPSTLADFINGSESEGTLIGDPIDPRDLQPLQELKPNFILPDRCSSTQALVIDTDEYKEVD